MILNLDKNEYLVTTKIQDLTPIYSSYLSPGEVEAMIEVDKKGVLQSSPEAQSRLQALATCLVTEAVNFGFRYPDTESAGLCLHVTPLFPIWEKALFGEEGS